MTDESPAPSPVRRPNGRPRLDQAAPLYRFSTRLPVAAADRLITLAERRGESVASVMRDLLLVRLR